MSKKNFSFKYDLERNSKSIAVKIYGIEKANSVLIISKSVKDSEFQFNLPIHKYAGFYIVAGEEKVDSNNFFVSTFTKKSDFVCINEFTSIASIYCFNKFSTISSEGELKIGLSKDRFKICQGMKNNFVTTDGKISKVIKSSPNGLETNSYPMFNSLANILYHCQKDEKVYDSFLKLTSTDDSKSNSNIQALLNLAENPFEKAKKIYKLTKSENQVFKPSIPSIKLRKNQQRIPTHWSLSIKVNNSGSQNFLISGPGYIDFDENDRVWVTNNTRQGTPNSSTFCVVLNSDGSPTKFSPVFGGGLLGGGFGIAANHERDKIYIGNYGWGPVQCNPQKGSFSVINSKGKLLSPSNGFTKALTRAQGMKFDSHGNLWVCSWGTQAPLTPTNDTVFNYKSRKSAVVVYPKADPNCPIVFKFASSTYMPFDLVIDNKNNVFVANSGDSSSGVKSSIYKFRLVKGEIKQVAYWESDYVKNKKDPTKTGMEVFRQICLNNNDEVFVGAISTNRILKFDNDLNYLRDFTNNIDAPWGVSIDGDNTIYSGNFIQEKTLKNKKTRPKGVGGPFGVTIVKNEMDKRSNFLNLPTGGAEVTLANGFPLYGNTPNNTKNKKHSKLKKSFQPLMRMTATRIDKVGNLWCVNNWKPAVQEDTGDNPGGDGLVVFIGAAVPHKTK